MFDCVSAKFSWPSESSMVVADGFINIGGGAFMKRKIGLFKDIHFEYSYIFHI